MTKSVKLPIAISLVVALSACGIFKGGAKKTPVLGDRVPILLSESSIVADRTLAGVEVVLPPAAVNEAWAQPGGSASKSMGHLALAEAPSFAWQVEVPGGDARVRLAAAPTIADGKMFVMDTAGSVHAYNATSGAPLWTTTTVKDGKNVDARFGGGASFEGGRVFAANGLGEVVALDAANGTEIWRAQPGGPLRGSPTLANGNVYAVSQDNQLFALNQADGAVIWTQSGSPETQGVFGVAAPASAQGTVVAGFSSGELNAYRYENGRSLWADTLSRTSVTTSVSSLADIDAAPVIDNGRAYAVGQGGRMVALELLTGQRLWEQNIAGISTPWVAGEWLFVVTDDARLICLSRGSGRIRWISQLPAFRNIKKSKNPISWVGPVLAGGRLWVANTDGGIASASPVDGTLGAVRQVKATFNLPPVVANNMLYILSDEGVVYAYR